MNYLDIRNAELRARWLIRYRLETKCADAYLLHQRAGFDVRYEQKVWRARRWLRAHLKRNNVVELRRMR